MVVHLFSSNSCLLVFLIAVAIVDVATRRIPNLLTVSAAVTVVFALVVTVNSPSLTAFGQWEA